VASLAAAGCLWGTGFLFGKFAFAEMTVSENVAYRFIFGSLTLAPILWKKPARFRGGHAWLLLLAASVIGVPIQFLLLFKGLDLTTVSHASLMVGTLPVLLALSSAVLLKDRLRGYEYGLMLLSGVGVVLIALARKSSGGPQPSPRGDLLVFLSMFGGLVMILISKRLLAEYGALEVTAWMIVMGTLVLVAWTEATHPLRFHFSSGVWAAAIAQGVLATSAAYLFWNWGLVRVPAARAGVFLNLEPLVGTLLGVLTLHESLGTLGILGGTLILVSAVHFSRRPE
jgi:drug/metabolite transporter (DMT)-like permease